MKMHNTLLADLEQLLDQRAAAHLRRERRVLESPQGPRVQRDGREYLNFCSNDYLSLANDPVLMAAAQQAVAEWGVGSGASHLVCGHQAPHDALETRFAHFVGLPAALLFSTGYMANLAVVTALMGRGDAVFADKLNHASLNDACLLSRADFRRYPHADLQALETLLAASGAARKMIVSDAVFSMDGDVAPLAGLLALAERYDAWLFLDDAHGFGVLGEGRGSLAHAGIALEGGAADRVIYLATLGKAAGTAGALVAAAQPVIDWLVNTARSYIYTTAMPAAWAAASVVALEQIEAGHERRARLFGLIALFRQAMSASALPLLASSTPIQPLLMPSNEAALALAQALLQQGMLVSAIRPPTVPTPRLRITLCAGHTREGVLVLVDALCAGSSATGAGVPKP